MKGDNFFMLGFYLTPVGESSFKVKQGSSQGVNDFRPADKIATNLIGRTIFVDWPHLFEARVVAVSDGEVR